MTANQLSDSLPEPLGELFASYKTGETFDEVFERDGTVRLLYQRIVERFSTLDVSELHRLEGLIAEEFRRQGITFTVYDDDEGSERVWLMDLFPRLISAVEWDELAKGLSQRVEAFNCFLADIYSGDAAVIADGIIPKWIVTSSTGFNRSAFGINPAHGVHCNIAGIDVVRDSDGKYRILEDNLRNPSGIAYVLENRAATAKAFPQLFDHHTVQPVEQYAKLIRSMLESMAPAAVDSPNVVVLTPGIFNSAYAEHVFLARLMGVGLVEGKDLMVDDHTVHARTIEGLVPVDVIYRRIDDDFLDPVAFRPDSTLGVPGLLGALRAGTVALCNAIGNGLADDKAVYTYVPDLIRYYLDAEPIIENVRTYRMYEPDDYNDAIGRLNELVVKPVAESGGYGVLIGPHATREQVEEARAAVEADPREWIVQELVELSSLPTLAGERLESRRNRFASLRADR